ncbi:MAG: acetate--CoA ligase family protein [Nitrospinaceae bacterium]|nr:MAG: acetate--CoA ligase family protein [Nitrospinaceae bacterium]
MNEARPEGPALAGKGESGSLETFFSPRAVAVIGASPRPGNLGARILASLEAHGYGGERIAVNPQALPVPPTGAVASVAELPDGVDLAIAAVPAGEVPGLVAPLAGRGIHHLIVVGGGFAETGREGARLQRALQDESQAAGVRVIGPNGLGVFSAAARFNSFFLSPGDIRLPGPGPVAILSQSGAFLSLLLDGFARAGVGVHRAVNFGNRADVGELELLDAFAGDPAVKVIGLYLESFADGARFVERARRVTREKPIVVWKGGQGERGGRAVRSHSASLAGSYPVFQAAVEKAGLIEARGFEEFQDALAILASQPVPAGDRVLIVSNGGGMGVFLTDLCERRGLSLPAPSGALLRKVTAGLPHYFSVKNPIDLTGSGTNRQCADTALALMGSGEFDALLLVLLSGTQGIDAEIASLLPAGRACDHPIAAAVYGEKLYHPLGRAWRKRGLPVFATAEAAAWALSVLVRRCRVLQGAAEEARPGPGEWAAKWRKRFPHPPHEMEIKTFLAEQGVGVPAHRSLLRENAIDAAAGALGYPLVLKAAVPGMEHKAEQKAVRTGIYDGEEFVRHWRDMDRLFPGALYAEKEAPSGLDLIVGFHRDEQFGPLLVFGAGGKYVETWGEVGRLLLPATRAELSGLVNGTAVGRVILGVRGEPSLAREELLEFVERAAWLFVECSEYASMEFNPVRLYEDRLVVLDAKLAATSSDTKGDELR